MNLYAIDSSHREPSRIWNYAVNAVIAKHFVTARRRNTLYRRAGLSLDRTVRIEAGGHFRTPNISIGRGSTVNLRCVFDNRAQVSIGSFVGVGIGVMFITSHHDYGNPLVRAGNELIGDIRVGDGAWIGSGAVLLPGVTVGEGAVVGANAVVARDVPAHTLVVGAPARQVRTLPGNEIESGGEIRSEAPRGTLARYTSPPWLGLPVVPPALRVAA